jgi:hypothetical protein
MMQSCASAAKLRAAGPILFVGIVCHVSCRFPPPRIVNQHGDDSHRSANLVHPDLAVADHNALVAGEQIVGLGGSDGGFDLGVKTRA